MTAREPFGRASDGAGACDAGERADVRGPRSAVAGLVLAGGASRRMGVDKARLELDGEPLLARALAVLSARCAPLWIASGGAERYGDLAARFGAREVVDDARWGERAGPLAGLVAGLEALARADGPSRLVALACDLPRVDGAVLDRLIAAADGADAAFASGDDGDHPLVGVYGARCLGAMRAALAAGRRRVTAFLDAPDLVVRRIPAADLGGVGVLANLNEPFQWEAERHRASPVAP